jgi:competence protein ComEC
VVPGSRRRGLFDLGPEIVADTSEPPLSLRVIAGVARVRQAIGRRVVEALPGQTGAIANALITGERGGISESTNQAFRDSGYSTSSPSPGCIW